MLPESDKKDEDLNRWVEEQLKARGLNPQDLSLEQMLALMQESVTTIIERLQSAVQAAGDLDTAPEIDALIQQAKDLQEDLQKLQGEVKDE